MDISAALVKELREKTGAGLMECKRALVETNGDIEASITLLREKGLSKAAKKSDRSTNEGKVFTVTSSDQKNLVITEINCETDFVANNTDFAAFGQLTSEIVLNNPSITTVESLEEASHNGKPFKDHYSEYVIKLGENIKVKRFQRLTSEFPIASYIHMNGKIGTAVVFSNTVDSGIARDIAMQVAATNPGFVRSEEVPQAEIENEKNILRVQVKNEGKPEAMVEKIVKGKLSKYFKDVCLLEQTFVKDEKKAVKDVLPNQTTIQSFIRFELV